MLEGYQYILFDVDDDCHTTTRTSVAEGWGSEANAEAGRAFQNTLTWTGPPLDSPEYLAFTDYVEE
eukprot:scaffold8133_cov621-Pinguiococcus_pyrenoidosus.AAC.1